MNDRLCDSRMLSMASKVLKSYRNAEVNLFNTTENLRQDLVDLTQRVITDDDKSTGMQLKAGQLVIEMEKLNFAVNRMNIGSERIEPTVMVLLPMNGTEVEAHENASGGEPEATVVTSAGTGCPQAWTPNEQSESSPLGQASRE